MIAVTVALIFAAWTEPTSYRGIPWGATVAEAREKVKSEWCRCSRTEGPGNYSACAFKPVDPVPLLRQCKSALDVGGVAVEDYLMFERDAFSGVQMTFASEGFDALRGVFVEKYGNPVSAVDEKLTNRMGVPFTNTRLIWQGPRVRIELHRFGARLDEGIASILLNDYAGRREAAKAAMRKKGAASF